MRNLFLAVILAAATVGTASVRGADGFDFSDMPPLPPPLLDDSASTPPPLTVPGSGAMSPLIQPPASAAAPTVSPLTPPPPSAPAAAVSAPPVVPPLSATPLAPPIMPSLAPPPPPVVADGASVGASAPAGTEPPPVVDVPPIAAESGAPSIPETPRPGKISGGRVNIRAGPDTQYESVAVLTTGDPVTVLARNGQWFKIIYPADQLASIHKSLVDADIAGEIPEAGLPGIVNSDNADVHAFYWDKSTVVGQLNKGDPVTIKQERGNWFRIAAPTSARAYVFAEYVRVDGGEAVAADAAPPPANPSVDLTQGKQDATGRLKLSENDKRAAALKEAYFKRLQEQHKREEEEASRQVSRLEEALDDLDARIRAIDQEFGAQLASPIASTSIGSAAWAPPDPVYGGYTGWVENIGRLGGAPSSFRLTKGGEIRFYLRSDQLNLGDFTGRRVWLNGVPEAAAGGVARMLNVNQIRILTDLEIAESMRQQQEAGQGTASFVQPSAEPFAASDPYAQLYSGTIYGQPEAQLQPLPQQPAPSDPSQLPDFVGGGYVGGSTPGLTGSMGEVESDYYENPVISEIGP